VTTSTVYVQERLLALGKGTQHIPSHSFLKVLVSHYHIIPMNATLRFHWSLSNSEVKPRIWTCVTRPFSHVFGHKTSYLNVNLLLKQLCGT